jgi:hypothetical protein
MVNFLIKRGLKQQLLILNNDSNDRDTIEYLKNIDIKIIHNKNNGPHINEQCNKHIYDQLPQKFILTDPDLELNNDLPIDFINTLSEISEQYQCSNVGFALDLSDKELFLEGVYCGGVNIYNWEKNFWNNKIILCSDRYNIWIA